MPELDFDELEQKSMPPMFSIGYDEMISIPEGVLPADCITEAGAIDINKAFNFFIKRVRELERQRDWLATFIDDNMECERCPYFESHCTDCFKWVSQQAEQAAKEAGE